MSEFGNESDNKCIECKEGFEVKHDFENDYNCYNICDFNYYYDSNNKYHCTDDNSCPTLISKLIKERKRCVDNCINYNLYEYNNNDCFNKYPNGTHINDNLCIEDLNCEKIGKFYNYNKSECFDYIIPGYFCNDSSLNTIDKCHENCKECDLKGTDENNKCILCPDSKFFDLDTLIKILYLTKKMKMNYLSMTLLINFIMIYALHIQVKMELISL